jgi:L,D-peptidoglycan transpeptidase YkuD (ErfK/YbiS/YcfS/YnhG family)
MPSLSIPGFSPRRADRRARLSGARAAGLARALALCACLGAALSAAGCASRGAPAMPEAHRLDQARQLVLVVTPDWNASSGVLQRYERRDGGWRAVGPATDVAVGRSGSAWGLGLHRVPTGDGGPLKREGDGRAPAGIFAIGTAFGYAGRAETALPYRAMSAQDYCIDVADSPLYNRIVDARQVGAAAVAGSTEPMRRDLHADGDLRYREGFVIEHNPGAVRGAGSCIFAHLWKAPGEATAGCTAMAPERMDALLGWLDPQQRPVFVLLPQAEHAKLWREWGLPSGAEGG